MSAPFVRLTFALTLFAVPLHAETPAQGLAVLVPKLMPQVVNIAYVRHQSPADKMKAMQADRKSVVPTGKGVGTGFIVDDNGIICTNRHVTDGGDEIYVSLSDNTRLRAELIYRSPDIDLALLRVHPARPLAAVTFGDSDKMVQGAPVVAIGNPLGLGGTVTSGIVSARDRDIHDTPYDSFMQIDAAINPGNSGGPLFNSDGEVIGMNTALITLEGADKSGSIGLNFAIPGNDVKLIFDLLRQFGQIRHGVLGAEVQDVTPGLADALGLDRVTGAIVATVAANGPAAAAGLRPGDIILRIGSYDVPSARRVNRFVTAQPGLRNAPLHIQRAGQQIDLSLDIGERAMEAKTVDMAMMMAPAPMRISSSDLGITTASLTPALRQRYKIAPALQGLVLTHVDPKGFGAYLGFTQGAVLLRIQDTEIRSNDDIARAADLATEQGRHEVAVLVADAHGTRWLAAPLARPR